MNTNDPFQNVLNGLEKLAGNLDAQTYPGQAWPVARPLPVRTHSSRRRAWTLAASLAAAAALAILAIHFGARSDIAPVPDNENALAAITSPQIPDDPIPDILIVEDADSYSIIDMTSGEALVSYATKDSYCPVCVVPLLPEQSMQPTTKAKKI